MEKIIYTDDLTGIEIEEDSGFELQYLGDGSTYLHAQSVASVVEQLLTGVHGEATQRELVGRGFLIITQAEVEELMNRVADAIEEGGTPSIQLRAPSVLGPIPEDAGPYDEELAGEGYLTRKVQEHINIGDLQLADSA